MSVEESFAAFDSFDAVRMDDSGVSGAEQEPASRPVKGSVKGPTNDEDATTSVLEKKLKGLGFGETISDDDGSGDGDDGDDGDAYDVGANNLLKHRRWSDDEEVEFPEIDEDDEDDEDDEFDDNGGDPSATVKQQLSNDEAEQPPGGKSKGKSRGVEGKIEDMNETNDQNETKPEDETKRTNEQNETKPRLPRDAFERGFNFLREKGYLSFIGKAELLFQDSHEERFFLIDGDSLLLDASSSETWHRGQQLHLFYLVELTLKLFRDYGGVFRIVFFRDFERLWWKSSSSLMAFYRRALISHLRSQCQVRVYTEWKNCFDSRWVQFLQLEHPEFLCVHTGFTDSTTLSACLNVMTYHALGHRVPVVYLDSVERDKTNLYGVHIGSGTFKVKFWTIWSSFLAKLHEMATRTPKVATTVDVDEMNDKVNHKLNDEQSENSLDHLTLGCITRYLIEQGRKNPSSMYSSSAASSSRRIHQWTLYFAIMSEKSLKRRLKFGSRGENSSIDESGQELNLLVEALSGSLFHDYGDDDDDDGADCVDKRPKDDEGSWKGRLELCDLIDSAVFDAILSRDQHEVTPKIKDTYTNLLRKIKACGLAVDGEDPFTLSDGKCMDVVEEEEDGSLKFPDFQGALVTEFAGDILERFERVNKDAEDASRRKYEEKSHWHALIPLKDVDENMDKPLPTNLKCREKQLRDSQKYNRYLLKYGATLNNHKDPKVIIAEKANESKRNKSKKQSNSNCEGDPDDVYAKETEIAKVRGKSKKDNRPKPKSKKEEIIEQNIKAKKGDAIRKYSDKWKVVEASLADMKSSDEKVSEVRKVVELDTDLEFPEPHQKLLSLLYDKWTTGKSEVDAAILLFELQKYVGMESKLAEKSSTVDVKKKGKLLKDIVKYFFRLGFDDIGLLISQKFNLSEHPPTISRKCPIGIPYQTFQMKRMGHLMTRSVRHDPDPRVTGFIPDTWQRKLLDTIDNNQSALVVAPTSSGKTFCSYYCIEKVIKQSDDGIVVYVSPTKALVNQVSASLTAKWRKDQAAGKTLIGVFTRDYKHNVHNCQILVTVPQCLEILLLSPKRQMWAKNIKYVIFDEVHCLGGEIGGEVWEHILTLVQCPFLALSATISNPHFFHDWLKSIAEFKNFNNGDSVSPVVNLVVYSDRYSDIEMSIYEDNDAKLKMVHPCGYLDSTLLAKKGFPECLKMSPCEAYCLWKAAKSSLNLERFDPEIFFKDKLYITKSDARDYETQLKKTIESSLGGVSLEPSRKTASLFLDGISVDIDGHDTNSSESQPALFSSTVEGAEVQLDAISSLADGASDKQLRESFPKLIDSLRDENKIPVIVFLCDREGIQTLATKLYDDILDKIERDVVLQKLLDKKTELEDKWSKVKRKARDRRVKGEGKDSGDAEDSEANVYGTSKCAQKEASVNIDLLTDSEKELFDKLKKSSLECKRQLEKHIYAKPGDDDGVMEAISKTSEGMRKLIKFGIGYHHAGCSTKDRQVVEMLFRMGKIQVVIATATLALGIHMPCKTVVFVGDDYYVDALNFRQMSGRSGRRGFDNIGHVVFYGVPRIKISKLIEANITQLRGRHPISLSTILKLFLLHSDAKDKRDAKVKAMSVLNNPFLAFQSPSHLHQLKLYFLFCCDVLFRQKLVNLRGEPRGFAGFVTHLGHHEPANLFFVHLLSEGLFKDVCVPMEIPLLSKHDNYERYECKRCRNNLLLQPRYHCNACSWEFFICPLCYDGNRASHWRQGKRHEKSDYEKRKPWLNFLFAEESLRNLVTILSYLFCDLKIPRSRIHKTENGQVELKVKPECGSKVILDPMPREFAETMETLNAEMLSLFENFLKCATADQPRTLQLPYSKKQVFTDKNLVMKGIESFARLSGCSDASLQKCYCEPTDFQRLLPNDFCITSELIPCLQTGLIKNSYALDFFKHKSVDALMEDNGLKSGDIFDKLRDFFLTILTIKTSLEQMEGVDHLVVEAFKHLAIVYRARYGEAFPGGRLPEW